MNILKFKNVSDAGFIPVCDTHYVQTGLLKMGLPYCSKRKCTSCFMYDPFTATEVRTEEFRRVMEISP